MTADQGKPPGAPSWATDPFEEFLHRSERLDQVTSISMRGIAVLQAMPRVAEVLAGLDKAMSQEEKNKRIEAAKEAAELAATEVQSDFPLLRSHAIIALWSYLEALIRRFVREVLRNQPELFSKEPLRGLKVRLGDFVSCQEDDRYDYISDLLEQETGFHLRNGVTKFEELLTPFGFGGSVPDRIKKDIFELGQIRNAVLHRAGCVDAKLKEACPWLEFEIGDQVTIDGGRYQRFFSAVHDYVVILIARMGESFGKDMSRFRPVE